MAEEKFQKELYITEESKENPWQLRYPLYYGIYKKALICILERISRWRNKPEEKSKDLQECDNIIAFTGVRGSGKTTAMIHFCRELEKNDDKFSEMYKGADFNQKNVYFHCLEMMELSMLEESEDIFELVLAKMLEWAGKKTKNKNIYDPEFNDFKNDVKYRNLCVQFDKVYRGYNAVKFKKQMEEYGESPLSRLNNLSSSLRVRKEFAKLLELFFEYVKKNGSSEEQVLIISFDDLDLNIKYGYEVLETVYRYMRHTRVIILLAMEQKQMEHICKNHILNEFDIRGASESRINDIEEHCEKLAKDYLKKMIPLDARIYMPDIKMESVQVAEDRSNKSVSQKMFIMEKYACKTGIYYDACGRKRHFCESDTIRTLVNYNYFLNALKDVDIYEGIKKEEQKEAEKKRVTDFQENYEQIYGDIKNRMVSELLSDSNAELFRRILQEDVSRWGRFVYKSYLSKIEKTEEKSIEELSLSYCYGDLLESIYYWGRKREKDKTLIHMILAMFSLEFTKEYVQYCNETGSGKHGERLREFMGRSLGGKWMSEGLPRTDVGPGMKSILYGYIPNVNMKKFRTGQFRLLSEGYSNGDELDELEEVLSQIKFKKMIETLEMISLFFSNAKDSAKISTGFKYVFKCSRDRYSMKNGERYQVIIQYDVDEKVAFADFDIWGVAGGIGFEERMVSLRDDIFQKLKVALKEVYAGVWDTAQVEQKLEELRSDLDIGSSYKKGEMPIPYYNLDLTYNIFKRVRQKSLRENPIETSWEKCVRYIVKMYQMFEKELENEIEKYKGSDEKSGLKEIKKNFSENSYIMKLLNREKYLPKGFDMYMGELIKAIAPLEYSGVEQ